MRLTALFFWMISVVPLCAQNQPVPAHVVGNSLPDSVLALQMVRTNGSSLTLGDMLKTHEGKKIVVDVWASWCRDCIIGYPKLDALRSTTDKSKTAFVFLSVDKDVDKWKSSIDKFRIEGEHYLLTGAWKNALSNYIVLDWVPRYLVIDEAGKIVMAKAIDASDETLKSAVR